MDENNDLNAILTLCDCIKRVHLQSAKNNASYKLTTDIDTQKILTFYSILIKIQHDIYI